MQAWKVRRLALKENLDFQHTFVNYYIIMKVAIATFNEFKTKQLCMSCICTIIRILSLHGKPLSSKDMRPS